MALLTEAHSNETAAKWCVIIISHCCITDTDISSIVACRYLKLEIIQGENLVQNELYKSQYWTSLLVLHTTANSYKLKQLPDCHTHTHTHTYTVQ